MPSSPGIKDPFSCSPTYRLFFIVSMCSACVASVPRWKQERVKIRRTINVIEQTLHYLNHKIRQNWLYKIAGQNSSLYAHATVLHKSIKLYVACNAKFLYNLKQFYVVYNSVVQGCISFEDNTQMK